MKISKTLSFVFAFAISLLTVYPSVAFACACCADDGFYSISTKKPGNLELGELKKIRFATANLFMTAAGEESVSGINPIGENYSLSGLLEGSVWKLNFKDEANRSGSLNLLKPVSMVTFMADIHDGKQGGAGGPLLYKEWRFKYKTGGGTGIFQKGLTSPADYFLVLQGRGNACTQAEDFTNWRLEITGRKADYAFYGKLASAQ